MKRPSVSSVLVALTFLLGGALLGAQFQASRSSNDAIEQFKKMKRAFVLISGKYVKQVSPKKLALGGVDGMLDRLDPHSSYTPAEEVKHRRDKIRGSFGGIGIRFDVLEDTARVVSPIEGGPSAEAGIRTGDRIVAVENSPVVGLSEQDLRQRLTGPKGSEVTFTVYRPISEEHLTFTIRRGEIPLHSINASYMIDDETGYLDIGRFAKPTYHEFVKAVDELQQKGLERLILDLRGNIGGVMQPAVDVANEMLGQRGQVIVQLKGRIPSTNETHRTKTGGILADEPIIVLVDHRTASSSEILAGALQDHDRALIVGRRTFGKALVQRSFPLTDGSLLNLTVGRYYTPTGRLIQTPYESGEQGAYYETKFAQQQSAVYNVREYKDSVPDSLTYRTVHGRTVFGGGGILPDYVVQPDTTSLAGFLRRREVDRLFAFFASEWFAKHERQLRNKWQNRPEAFLSSYRAPEEAISHFWSYAERKGVLTLTTHPDSVNPRAHVFPETKTSAAEPVVRTHLRGQLAEIMFGEGTGQSTLNSADPIVQKALSLWPSSRELASYHTESSREGDE